MFFDGALFSMWIQVVILLQFATCHSILAADEGLSINNGRGSSHSEREGGCNDDVDCQLNGVCQVKTRTCLCDAAWTGQDCGLLNLLPSPHQISFHGTDLNSTSWGGSVLFMSSRLSASEGNAQEVGKYNDTEAAASYVMYVAEMTKGCGLREWRTNSAVVVATATNPVGPYKRHGEIIPPWSHNPQAIQITQPKLNNDAATNNGENAMETVWAVYTLGDGDGKPVHGPVKDCTNSTKASTFDTNERIFNSDTFLSPSRQLFSSERWDTNSQGTATKEGNRTVYFTIHYSIDGPLGPFQKHVASITDFPNEFEFPSNFNPAPVAMPMSADVYGNIPVRMMVHTNNAHHAQYGIIVEASTWKGPYKPITMDVTHCTLCQEDPFLWIDHRGHWHALYHKMFDPIMSTTSEDEWEDEKKTSNNVESSLRATQQSTPNVDHTQKKDIDGDYYGYLYDDYDGHPDRNGCCPSPGWSGGHAFSKDGLTWSTITRCYNTTTHYEDGTTIEMVRRERPKLIFDPNDGVTPTHLVNGVFNLKYGTYTLVTPINRA